MSEPGDTLCLADVADGGDAAQQLDGKPIEQHEGGRDIDGGDEDNDEDERDYAHARIQDEEGAHDAGNGAAGADGGDGTAEVGGELDGGRSNAADQIEDGELGGPHGVLNVRSEDPQEPHVADEVEPAAVQEHGGDEGGETQLVGDERVVFYELITQIHGARHFVEKKEDVQSNDEQRHHGRGLAGEQCAKRNHLFRAEAR